MTPVLYECIFHTFPSPASPRTLMTLNSSPPGTNSVRMKTWDPFWKEATISTTKGLRRRTVFRTRSCGDKQLYVICIVQLKEAASHSIWLVGTQWKLVDCPTDRLADERNITSQTLLILLLVTSTVSIIPSIYS